MLKLHFVCTQGSITHNYINSLFKVEGYYDVGFKEMMVNQKELWN